MPSYRVNPDDNLLTLAQKFGTTTAALQKTNGIRNLTAGQTIRVPSNWMGGNATEMSLSRGSFRGYTTGENERKTAIINGQTVRLGPNTSLFPSAPAAPKTFFQKMFDALTGNEGNYEPSGQAGVRGSVVPREGSGGHNARPIQPPVITGSGVAVQESRQPGSYPYASSNPQSQVGGYGYQPPQQANIGAGNSRFNPLAPQPAQGQQTPMYGQSFGNYGIPETVRNTLTSSWNGSLTLDMASMLYPGMSNQELTARLQSSGATFNMRTNSWDIPEGLTGGTTNNPNTPQTSMTQDQQSQLYQENRNTRTGESYIQGTARYGQSSQIVNGQLINRDNRRIKPKEEKWNLRRKSQGDAAAAAQTPQDTTGQVNSLVTWRV